MHVFTPRMRILVQCARLNARMTIQALSNVTKVSAEDLIAIEEGRMFPPNKLLEQLQTILNVRLVPPQNQGFEETV